MQRVIKVRCDEKGFTLIELLVVISIIAILAALLMPALARAKERAFRVSCMNNFKQIGTAIVMYQNDYEDYFPLCNWPEGQNPWQTYEACRVQGSIITRGPYNLGLLHYTGFIKDPRVFYCPSAGRISDSWRYDYYAAAGVWPSAPAGDDNVRTSYNYYPQRKETERVGSYELPKLVYTRVKYAVGELQNVAPMKSAAINYQKSISTDLVHSLKAAPHKDGRIAGLNTLFPDGHVVWQTARRMPEAFDDKLWENVGSNPQNFRYLMSLWRP
jgi:prepilin-type N-terminal cleavage/methylation domain-containing protein